MSGDGAADGRSESEGELETSRRDFALGVGGLGALALGGAGAYLSTADSSTGQTYIVKQGKLRWEASPVSYKDKTVETFYGYQSASGSANPAIDLASDGAASRLFLYEGPVGTSLVFLHGGADAEQGGTAFFKFSGLSRSSGEWAVRDDAVSVDDDFEKWEGGNAKVKWEWGAGETDGGAFWGVGDTESTIKVSAKTLRGVDAWTFRSGDDGSRSFEVTDAKPVSIRSAEKKSVKRVNVDIMPESDANTFDPYAKDAITVAVKSPPDGADESEWVSPGDVDPGNVSVNFGSRRYLAGGNGASPQRYSRQNGALYLEYKVKAASFSLDSAYGFLVGKTDSYTWFRGKDAVQPGGFNNADSETPLVVTDLNANPEGGDAEHLAAEYVEFTNDGDAALDLTGHTVTDSEGWEFHFPDGFTLDAGASVRLHTGGGEWTDADLYWGLDTPVWGNEGDTIRVTDADGDTILRHTYSR